MLSGNWAWLDFRGVARGQVMISSLWWAVIGHEEMEWSCTTRSSDWTLGQGQTTRDLQGWLSCPWKQVPGEDSHHTRPMQAVTGPVGTLPAAPARGMEQHLLGEGDRRPSSHGKVRRWWSSTHKHMLLKSLTSPSLWRWREVSTDLSSRQQKLRWGDNNSMQPGLLGILMNALEKPQWERQR